MIETYTQEIPWLTTEQMIEVDRAMVEEFRIDLLQMMENAGRALAIVARECFLDSDPVPVFDHRMLLQYAAEL